MSTDNQNRLDHVADVLSSQLEPVVRFAHPFIRILPWLVFALVYTYAAVQYIGVRPDIAVKLADPLFLFETAIGLAMSMSAAMTAAWLCVPDMRGQVWMVAFPALLGGVFLVWETIRSVTEGLALQAPHWDHCFEDALLFGTVPAAVLIFTTVRGATTRPFLMALMNVIAVAALAYVGLRFTCMLDTVGHSLIYHVFPFVVFGSVLGLAARRVFRW